MSTWDVARDIVFDPSQHPSDVIMAAKHLFAHRPPRVVSPELEEWEEKLRATSDAEIDAALLELEAADNEPPTSTRSDADAAADTENGPEPSEAPGAEVRTRCLEILRRIGDGVDSRASGRDRMRAAALREQYLAATSPGDAIRDEIESWTPEELESFLAEASASRTGEDPRVETIERTTR